VLISARQSCKDRLRSGAVPDMVPGLGFEPSSPVLQTGAFTRLAFQAYWCGLGDSNSCCLAGNEKVYH
jgi:hypothetical protein